MRYRAAELVLIQSLESVKPGEGIEYARALPGILPVPQVFA